MKTHGAVLRIFAIAFSLLLAGVVGGIGSGSARAAPPGSKWGANYFPNIMLMTQDGKKVRFYDDLIKDKVVAISFIYTHCKDSCPLETANLRQVQRALGDRVGRDVFFYSISIDPDKDTPAVLQEYARKFKAGPGWSFLTGNKEDIKLLRQKLGLYAEEEADGKRLGEHNISIMIGNEATGQWMKRSPFDEPKVLARLLGSFLQLPKNAQTHSEMGAVSYAEAPRLPKISRGEELFRSRCDSCHSLGSEDGMGPGLAGVTEKRHRVWLARWLKEPDQMLIEKDAIAMAIFDQYRQLPMPNLRLSDADVDALIEFMQARSVTSGIDARKP